LGLPRAFQQSGIAAGVRRFDLISDLSPLTHHSNNPTCDIGDWYGVSNLESSWPKVDHNTMQTTRTLSTRSTYSAIARLTIGRHGPTLVEVSIVVTLWGACAVYMITISQLLNEVAPVISRAQYTLATGLLLLPFSFASDLSFLSWVSTVCSRTRR
jgi:hypothetical protein